MARHVLKNTKLIQKYERVCEEEEERKEDFKDKMEVFVNDFKAGR